MNFRLLALLAVLSVAFAAPISHDEIEEKASQGLRLLSLAEGAEPVWKTEDEKLDLLRQGINFFDVTEVYELDQATSNVHPNGDNTFAAPYPPPSHQAEVKPLFGNVSIENMQSYLSTLTAFNNRYYRSSTGAQAATWILDTAKEIAKDRSDVTVSAFTHSWVQPSTIARIAGKTDGPVTILGAHMDSINLNNPNNGRAPGADDDGTGTVNLIEAFRVLIASGFEPSTPVEFHWYAGEEAGLLGSQAIAKSYKSSGVQVKAFMQFDMTGYFKKGTKEVIGIIGDFVNQDLTTFLKALIDTYASIPWAMDQCGYACSDHASWNKAGYPGAFPFESLMSNDNPKIHSTGDTTSVDGFSWTHSAEFAKLAVAFAYELGI